MSLTQGIKLSSNITAATQDAGVGQRPDLRRLYDFSDRVAELAPEESPFFVYLSQVAKSPTDDSVFRYLENRSKINMTTRNFLLAANVNGGSTVSADSSYTFTVDADTVTGGVASGGSSVNFLIKGMVFVVNTTTGSETSGYAQVMVRIETSPNDDGDTSTFTGKVIDVSNSGITGYNVLSDNDVCQVIGTAFAEGSASPDTFSTEIEDDFGFTQIFKTACELSNTAIATRYRGYANEFERIWATKLREHKVDIERAMLFGQKARIGGVQYSEGLVGHIVKNASPKTDDSAFAYTSGAPYYRSVAQSELTYDRLLADLEVIFDPARGGSSDRLVLASLPVITFFNKLGDGAFMDASIGSAANMPYRMEMESRTGAFGHKVMTIDTVHGTMHLVKEPLFRGLSSGFMLMADMSKLMYRPLVGNGLNRDTHIITNVQNTDEDLRKDMVITEAGLEITLPECHALYEVESV